MKKTKRMTDGRSIVNGTLAVAREVLATMKKKERKRQKKEWKRAVML